MTGKPAFWRRPGLWILLSVLAAASTGAVYLVGIFSGGLDTRESCERLHQPYDDAYRSAHPEDPGFPLHNRCNAGFDLVPAWVNPALVVLALVAVVCVVLALTTGAATVMRIVERRKKVQA